MMREDEEEKESNKGEDDRRTYSISDERLSSWTFPSRQPVSFRRDR